MQVSAKDRALVYERDGHRCVSCDGVSLLTIQHRANRGIGGNPNGARNILSNLLTQCVFCNQLLEQSAEFAAEGLEKGWKLKSGQSPMEVPVFYSWADEWRLLLNDGSTRLVEAVQ